MVDYSQIYGVVASILLNGSGHRDLYALLGFGGDKMEGELMRAGLFDGSNYRWPTLP